MILFGGTLKDYAEMLLKDGRGDGSVVCLGEVHETVIKELSRRDIQLADTRIIVDQHSVTKYFAHPKNPVRGGSNVGRRCKPLPV